MSKEKLIPEFRFPEFENSGEWQYEYGDELFEPISNKNHNSDLPILAITQEQGAIPRDLIDYHVSVSEKSVERYKVVEIGDFIISLRSFQGGIEYSNYLGLCSPAYIILRKKRDVLNDFYRHYFKSFLFIQDLNRNLEGIRDGKMISYKQFSEILIPNPRKQEQQKIASCLSSLDELIAAHNDKLDALKDHKKGLLQNLFPQEGERVPKFRFPEFENDGEWVEKKLGDLTEKIGDGIHTTPKYDDSGDYFFINGNNLIDGKIYVGEKTKRVSRLEYEKHKKELNETTVLLSINGTIGNVAFYNKESVVLGKSACYMTPNQELNSIFLFYSLQCPKITSFFFSELTGSTIKNLSLRTIRETAFGLPTIQEQQKIASCLSALDELITAQQEKIEQLKMHKKGLMQGLFPSAV